MVDLSEQTIRKSLKRIDSDVNNTLKAPPRMSVPEWADTYRRLSTSTGAIGGPWRTSRVEVARGPMMAVKESGVRAITLMSCTQLMKTSLIENVIGYHAHLDPCPMLLTQPKEGAVKAFSKERLVPMARATPVLAPLLGDERTRRSEDTINYKEFSGGFLALESAGSPTNLAMRAIRITLADEVDKYETTKEGDPLILLEERTSTFATNSLHIRCCSPTWVETSRIYKSYLESDQRKPYVACPHCKHETVLDFFKHVEWNKSEEGEHFPFTAAIYCESCGAEWTEAERLKIMTTEGAIKWRQTRPFVCCDERQEPMKTRKWKWDEKNKVGLACCTKCKKPGVPNTHAGFNAGKLYSPFITVPELAEKWILSKDDPETKQTFYNTQLGLPYESQAMRRVNEHELAARREQYVAPVPLGALVLTAGIDVQSGSEANLGRVEIETVAWGIGEESWSVDYKVISGDPALPGLWNDVDAYLLQSFKHENGRDIFISAACIDTGGYQTDECYKFARKRIGRNIWPIKGAAERGATWSPVWPIPKLESKKTRRTGYKPIMLGVNAAKENIRQKLLVQEIGPGYCHFPLEYPEAGFEQLTAESLTLEKKQGVTKRKWVLQRGRANERLDTRVYAYGALNGLYAVRKLSLEKVAASAASFVPAVVADEFMPVAETAVRLNEVLKEINNPKPAPAPKPKPAPAPKPSSALLYPPRSRVRRSSFVG